MAEYLLSRWEAIELFCEVISKAEGKSISPIEDFITSNLKLRSRLNSLQDEEGSKEFSKKYFEHKRNTAGKLVPVQGDLMSFLSRHILIGIPFLIAGKDLEYIITFIDGKDSARLGNFTPYVDSGLHSLSNKQRTFERTDWWLYYHSQFENDPKTEVISKAVLSLLPFGRAKITRPLLPDEKTTDDIQIYLGQFSMYGGSNELIKMQFKTDKGDRDLHILVYVGDTIPPVAIGAYNNHYISMNSGAVFLERIEDEQAKSVIKSGKEKSLISFTTENDPEYKEIRPSIIDFLTKNKRYFHVAKGKNSFAKIIEWLNDEGKFED